MCADCYCFLALAKMLPRALSALLVAVFIVQTCGNSQTCPGCTLASKSEPFSRLDVHQAQRDPINPCIFAQITALRLRGGAGYRPFPGDEEAADEALDELYENLKEVQFLLWCFCRPAIEQSRVASYK
jgi:hypothetical protein